MSEILFGRKVEVITGTPNNGQRKFDGDDFTIYFEIPFDDGVEPNIGTVQIYNLSDNSIVKMGKGTKITLNAGYQKDIGAIFVGEVQIPTVNNQSVDKILRLDCMDSGEKWFKTKVKKTYKAKMTGKQILNDLLKLTGLATSVLKLPKDKIYTGGKTFNTTLASAISEVAKDCGAKMHVNKGKIFIRPKNEGDNIRYVISAENSLIGSPTRIQKEVVTGKDKAGNEIKTIVYGWKIVTLLNHRITTDSVFEIKSKTANGTFRVEKGKHTANGTAFYTESEVYPL